MFHEKVDYRSRKTMIEFLADHFRYNTMNSWNRSTSYANNMKIHKVGLPNTAYDLLDMQEVSDEINSLIRDWEEEHNCLWQAGFNGRSGGYLVLYEGKLEPSGYKSYCTSCGQLCYATTEKDNKCGRCGANARVDFVKPHMRVVTYPGRSIDQGEDFSDWSMDALKERVRLVQSFDLLCDEIIGTVRNICEAYEVVEEEILVPKKVKVLQAV